MRAAAMRAAVIAALLALPEGALFAGEPLDARGNRGGDPRGRPAGHGGALARVASSERNFAQLALSSDDISVELHYIWRRHCLAVG